MKFTHPVGNRDIFSVNGSKMLAEVEMLGDGAGWTAFGGIGEMNSLFVEADEWDAFVALVKEIDEARK